MVIIIKKIKINSDMKKDGDNKKTHLNNDNHHGDVVRTS